MIHDTRPLATSAAPPAAPSDSMRRVQIGIAGVLTVLLLVGMAGLIGDRVRETAAKDAAADVMGKMPGQEQTASAPLEELGVQPVSGDSKDQNRSAPIKVTQPARSAVPDLEPDPDLERARQSNR